MMVTSNVHFNILKPSDIDTIELGFAVEERFLDVLGTYLRVRGVPLSVPVNLNQDMLRWREMRVRHKYGDLRNTESELKSTQAIAEWTIVENAKLRNQQPKTVEWKD